MGTLELVQQKSFLGKEFLTWLWFRSEIDPAFDLPGNRRCEVEMLDQIALDAGYGDAKSTALKGESPGTSPEATTALIQGKKLKRARLKVAAQGVEWTLALDGESMNLQGLRLPAVGKLPFEEGLALRMEFIDDFERMLEDLLGIFLEIRFDDKAWGKELGRIHAWASEKEERI